MIKFWKLFAPKYDYLANHRVAASNGVLEKFQNGRKMNEIILSDVSEVHYNEYLDNQKVFEYFDCKGNCFVIANNMEGFNEVTQELVKKITEGSEEDFLRMKNALQSRDAEPKLFWKRNEL